MLRKLSANNFRVYKKKTFTFHKNVTVIIGPNDRGKSTIVNLLRWIFLNRPSGRTVIRRGAKQTKGSLSIDNTRIQRTLGRGGTYRVGRKLYKAFGTRVPESVSELAKVTDLNFQRQHESSFWLALSPGQVAKELNSIVDLQSIDTVQTSLAKQIRETSAQIKVCEERLRAASESRRALAWVRQFDVAISRAERAASRYRAKSATLAAVASALKLALSADTQRRRLSTAAPIAQRAALAGRKWRAASGRLTDIRAAYRAAESASGLLAVALPDVERINEVGQRAINTANRLRALQKLVRQIKSQERQLCQCAKKLKRKQDKLERSLGGRCPTCGGILTNQMKLY